MVAAREKIEKDRKKYVTPKRRTFHMSSSSSSLTSSSSNILGVTSSFQPDKYGILSAANRRLKSNVSSAIGQQESPIPQSIEVQLKALLTPSKTVDSFESIEMPIDDNYLKNANINSSEYLTKKMIKSTFIL